MIDFLIVGHGLAGSVLAHMLLQRGYQVVVLDNHLAHAASTVAAGLINPLIGPKFNIPLHMKECLLENERFLRPWEEELGHPLLKKFVLHRIFVSEDQRDLWIEKMGRPDFRRYAQAIETAQAYENHGFEAPLGGGSQLAHRLDFSSLLKHSKEKLRQQDAWQDGRFKESDWPKVKKIIFCEGYRAVQNPWFKGLPFAPAQGETLVLKKPPELAASNGTWIIPERLDNSLAGSTWKHKDLESGPTGEGRNSILDGLSFLTGPQPQVIGHFSGIRSGTKDRAPLMGTHRENEKMSLFNGFGSRGGTTIPYYARHMLDFLIDNHPLPEEADCKRSGSDKNEPLSR